MRRKHKIAHQTRAQQLESIPDYLRLDIDRARDLTLARLRSREARLALQEFAETWGEGDAATTTEPLHDDIATAALCAAEKAVFNLRTSAADREKAIKFKDHLNRIAEESAELLKMVRPADIDQRIAHAFEEFHGRPFVEALADTGYFDLPFKRGPGATEPAILPQLTAQIRRTLELINVFELNWKIPEPEASNSAPLSSSFIRTLACCWKLRLGESPGRGRRGPFVRLVTEAWRLVGFHSPVPDDELEDWIGGRVEQTLREEYALWQPDEGPQTW